MNKNSLNQTQPRGNRKRNPRRCHGVIVEVFGRERGPDLTGLEAIRKPTARARVGAQEHHLLFLWESSRSLDADTEADVFSLAYRLIDICQADPIAVELVHYTCARPFQWREDALERAWEHFVDLLGVGSSVRDEYVIRAQCWAGTPAPQLKQ